MNWSLTSGDRSIKFSVLTAIWFPRFVLREIRGLASMHFHLKYGDAHHRIFFCVYFMFSYFIDNNFVTSVQLWDICWVSGMQIIKYTSFFCQVRGLKLEGAKNSADFLEEEFENQSLSYLPKNRIYVFFKALFTICKR